MINVLIEIQFKYYNKEFLNRIEVYEYSYFFK